MKKLIAPIIITVILVVFYLQFFLAIILISEIPLLIKAGLGIVPAALAGVCIYVCVERYKEIRSGEEDDLSQY